MSRLLVIEDDEKIAAALSIRLSRAGHEVLLASDAPEGCRLATEDIELILLDLAIPAGGGFAVLQDVRERRAASALPIVVLTASGLPEHRAKAEEFGADAYIEKPYDMHVVQQRISELLLRSPSQT